MDRPGSGGRARARKKQRLAINNSVGCSPERLRVCYEPNNDVIGPRKRGGRDEKRVVEEGDREPEREGEKSYGARVYFVLCR